MSLEPVSRRRDLLRKDATEESVPGKVHWMLIFQNKGKISFQIFHGLHKDESFSGDYFVNFISQIFRFIQYASS